MNRSPDTLTPEEIAIVRGCLAQILESDLFFQSARQSRFLTYIVEQTLKGEGKKIKQYSIGLDVFDRDEAFDPAIDSIVRVEAGRLRSKLREYYSNPASEDAVVIALRKGKYAVNFRFRDELETAASAAHARPVADSAISLINAKPLIAVLAFNNTSGDPEQEYFADGISEDIITDLSHFPELAVIARHSSFSYKNKDLDTKAIAQQLGADYILEGSVRKAGSRVRISAQLIDTKDLRELWAERYDRELDDIFTVQDDVSRKIIAALQVTLDSDENTGLTQKNTSSMEAYDCVLRGAEYARHSNRENLIQARALFRRAISIDNEYAEAYARLSRLCVYQWISGLDKSGQDVLHEAQDLACRAVALGPNLPLSHASLGWVYQWMDENDKAVTEWQRAIELDPSQADALNWLSLNLAWSGHTQEALEKLECARRLNPLEKYYFPQGMIAFMDGQYDEAIALFEKLIAKDPAFLPAHLFLASSYGLMGLEEKGLTCIKNILVINPNYKILKTNNGSIMVPEIQQRFRQSLVQLGLPVMDQATPPA